MTIDQAVVLWNQASEQERLSMRCDWLTARMLYGQTTLDRLAGIRFWEGITANQLTDELANSLDVWVSKSKSTSGDNRG